MCNIITYQFACPHRVRRRRSPCHGAKVKPPSSTSSAPRAACVAECFLTVHLRAACNECNHKTWDTTWQAKISRADAYLAALKEQYNSTEAVQTIEALRQEVDERRRADEWDLRHSITLLPARHVPRVQHRPFVRSPSSLSVETRPEDVREEEKGCKDWSEMKEEDYDDDYVASTDPIHPVTTDYRYLGEGEDDEWVKQYLADRAEDVGAEDMGGASGWEESGGWDWGDGDDEGGGEPVMQGENWKEDALIPGQQQPAESARCDGNATNTAAPSSSTKMPSSVDSKPRIDEMDLDDRIAHFWSHVALPSDTDTSINPPTSPSPDPSPTILPWIDGTHDAPLAVTQAPATLPPPSLRLRNPRPRSTHYDKLRRLLIARKELDERKFYRDWLTLSRCEIREYEGLGEGGRRVIEPVGREGGGMSGGGI